MKKILLYLLLIPLFLCTPSVSAEELLKDNPTPVITNVAPTSFSISWYSREKEEQVITYGKTQTATATAVDDRGPGFIGVTHHVTLVGLEPNTDYFFRINNGQRLFRQKTLTPIPNVLPPLPERFRGKTITEDNTAPEEAIIYMKILGAQLLSARTNQLGEWQIRTVNTRWDDFSKYYRVREIDYVDFYVRAGYEGENAKRVFAYARENPIDINLTTPKIPFYKIKFPGQEVYEATLAAAQEVGPDGSPRPGGVQPASNEGFFSTLWRRVREIF